MTLGCHCHPWCVPRGGLGGPARGSHGVSYGVSHGVSPGVAWGGLGAPAWVSHDTSPLSPVNKRLDEWVTHDRLDLKRVQVPRKEAKTPTKNGLPGSRPGSPDRDPVRDTGTRGGDTGDPVRGQQGHWGHGEGTLGTLRTQGTWRGNTRDSGDTGRGR